MQAGLAPPSSVSKRHLHPPSTPGPNSSSLAALRADIQASASATTLQRQLLGSQRENNQLNRELGALQERIKSLERERSILLSREEGSQIKEQEEREKVEREKRSLVESLGEYRAKCEELEDELEELKSYQSRLSHDADLAVEEKSSIEKQMEVLQEELGKVDQENAKLKTEHEELVQARETIVQLQKQLAERPQQQQNPGTSEGVAAGDATSTASEGAADSKAPQEVPITEVLRKELHHQVQHLRTLEHTNARLTREVNAFKQDRHNFELLKEEKLSLETKLRHMQTLRRTLTEKELELENLQRERKEWTAFLTSSENEPDRERFESPAQMAKALASCRIEILSLQDKLGSVTASVRSRDSTIEELEERLREVEDELVPQVRKELDEARDRIRSLQRKADLDDKELSMLREQIVRQKLKLDSGPGLATDVESFFAFDGHSSRTHTLSKRHRCCSRLSSSLNPARGRRQHSTSRSRSASPTWRSCYRRTSRRSVPTRRRRRGYAASWRAEETIPKPSIRTSRPLMRVLFLGRRARVRTPLPRGSQTRSVPMKSFRSVSLRGRR